MENRTESFYVAVFVTLRFVITDIGGYFENVIQNKVKLKKYF